MVHVSHLLLALLRLALWVVITRLTFRSEPHVRSHLLLGGITFQIDELLTSIALERCAVDHILSYT